MEDSSSSDLTTRRLTSSSEFVVLDVLAEYVDAITFLKLPILIVYHGLQRTNFVMFCVNFVSSRDFTSQVCHTKEMPFHEQCPKSKSLMLDVI